MSDLKKLMQEYRERINDPTYVAPAELRNMKQSMSVRPIPEPVDHQAALKNSMHNVMGVPTPQKESERMFVKGQDAGSQSYLQEVAKSLGVTMKDGAPILDDSQESEMNSAIDKMIAGEELDPRQVKWNDLMTDWKD